MFAQGEAKDAVTSTHEEKTPLAKGEQRLAIVLVEHPTRLVLDAVLK